MLLINLEIMEEIKEEIKKYLETNDNENTMTQGVECKEMPKAPQKILQLS